VYPLGSWSCDPKTIDSDPGYAAVNGINLYHELYGPGDPLVLLPGGLMTIPEMNALVQPLATAYQVIAVELQGHGRTADTDRPLSLATMGDDIATLLDLCGPRFHFDPPRRGVFCAARRRDRGTGLGQHEVHQCQACHRARLQPLQHDVVD
jgi:molybdenum cofactor biosynthesis enzyme MoaA